MRMSSGDPMWVSELKKMSSFPTMLVDVLLGSRAPRRYLCVNIRKWTQGKEAFSLRHQL